MQPKKKLGIAHHAKQATVPSFSCKGPNVTKLVQMLQSCFDFSSGSCQIRAFFLLSDTCFISFSVLSKGVVPSQIVLFCFSFRKLLHPNPNSSSDYDIKKFCKNITYCVVIVKEYFIQSDDAYIYYTQGFTVYWITTQYKATVTAEPK